MMRLRCTTSNSGKEHASELPRCLTLDMTRRILARLAITSFVLVVFALPLCAQERQIANGAITADRSQENRLVMDTAEAEKLRSDLITVYQESEALIRFLAGYDFIRQSNPMEDYEAVCQKLEKGRSEIEHLSTAELMTQVNGLPDAKSFSRIIENLRAIRNDAKLQEVIRKAARLSQAGLLSRASASGKAFNSRGVVSAPAYIAPICNFDDPSNYPSGADIAISNGVALALHALYDALPGLLGFFVAVPNPVKIALAIAAYAVDEVTSALEAVASDAAYCETVILYMEDNLVNDEGYVALLITNDFYLSYLLKTVRSALTKATNTTIPTNCGSARLTEASAFFDGSDNFIGSNGTDRVTAYQKLRAAYQNIGASSCVQ